MQSNDSRRRWLVAAAVATAVVGGWLAIFRLPGGLSQPRMERRPASSLRLAKPTEADVVLKDEATIRDLRPLFLPTDFNASLGEPRREPGRTILDEEKPRWAFTEMDLGLSRDLPPPATLNGQPAEKAKPRDVLAAAEAGVGLTGYGRQAAEVEPVVPRGGFVEVVAVSTGQVVLAEPLPPQLGPAGGKPWEPLELFAAIAPAGLAAPLVVTEGSRVEEVDLHFKKTLSQSYRIGERLAPGFYRIVVGP